MRASERAKRYRDEESRDGNPLAWTLLHFSFYLLPVAAGVLLSVITSADWWIIAGAVVFVEAWVWWRTCR